MCVKVPHELKASDFLEGIRLSAGFLEESIIIQFYVQNNAFCTYYRIVICIIKGSLAKPHL